MRRKNGFEVAKKWADTEPSLTDLHRSTVCIDPKQHKPHFPECKG
jgi:hypothetical protein